MHGSRLKQYFDLTVVDVEARRFFEACLRDGGLYHSNDPWILSVQAGAPEEPGVGHGGIGSAEDFPQSGRPLPLVTIPVPDVDDVVAKVEQNGERAVVRLERFLGIGWFCTCAEPGCFGVLQPTRPQSERANSGSFGYLLFDFEH